MIGPLPVVSEIDGLTPLEDSVSIQYRDPTGATYTLPIRFDQLSLLRSQIDMALAAAVPVEPFAQP